MTCPCESFIFGIIWPYEIITDGYNKHLLGCIRDKLWRNTEERLETLM